MTCGRGHSSEGRGQEVRGGTRWLPDVRELSDFTCGTVSQVTRGQRGGRAEGESCFHVFNVYMFHLFLRFATWGSQAEGISFAFHFQVFFLRFTI